MKSLKLNFTWKGKRKVWYPLQTVTSLIVIGLILISPFIIKESVKHTYNYLITNYEVDDKGTLDAYDDNFVRIEK